MALSSAERQRRYRERHLKDPDGEPLARLNLMLSEHMKRNLERLSASYGVTIKATLERLIREETTRVLTGLSGADQNAFYDGKINLKLRSNEKDAGSQESKPENK